MLFDAPSLRAYNVGGADSFSIGELAERVNRVLGGAGTVRIAKAPQAGAAPQAYIPSTERIASELGLVPSIGLDEAILRTARWAASHLRNRYEQSQH
jgi:dTDP-glucose 4,6-dehydratase